MSATKNLTGSKFLIRANVRKHLNSPAQGVTIHGGVSAHDGVLDLFGALHNVILMTKENLAEFEVVDEINITFITAKP